MFLVRANYISPFTAYVSIGANTSFECLAYTPILWLFMKKLHYPEDFGTHDQSRLVLRNVRPRQSGYYVCYGSLENGTRYLAVAELKITGEL